MQPQEYPPTGIETQALAGAMGDRPDRRRLPRTIEAGLLAGALAPVIAWALSVVVIASWPGYDPIRQSISLLADAPLGGLQTLAFALSGVLGAAWAIALTTQGVLGASLRGRLAIRALLLLQAVIALGFAALPTDPAGVPASTVGKLHLADFYAYAATMPITLFAAALVMRRDPRWHGSANPTLLAAALALTSIALVPATVDGPLTPWLGLLERLFVAIPSVWQVGVSVVALRLVLGRHTAARPSRPSRMP